MTGEAINLLYETFCHKMWSANCLERDAYGETVLTKSEYITQNEDFLLDQFWLKWEDKE